jgi:hypothetical protein
MGQKNSSLREGLLARLPQPENLQAYQEETATLLAKHERATRWQKIASYTVLCLGATVFWMVNPPWRPMVFTNGKIPFDCLAALLFFAGWIAKLNYCIARGKVQLLKEVKQVQLQILELQASLHKER